MKYRLLAIAVCLSGALFPNTAHALQREPGAYFVMPNSARCTPAESGTGSSPDDPLAVELHELIEDARGVHEDQAPSTLDCRWVRVTGHFIWVDYWHYRGRLYSDLLSAYAGGDGVWIERFADRAQRRAPIKAALIEVVGLYYDLCARAAAEAAAAAEDGALLLNMGGPCHYHALNGLMLTNVRIVARHSAPDQRLRGEDNRTTLGDLVRIESDHAAWADMRAVVLQWIASLRAGEEAYLTATESQPDRIAEQLADPDDWSSYLTDDEKSPLRRLPDDAAFAVFLQSEDVEDFSQGDYRHTYAYGCFCLSGDCADAWPLMSADARRHTDDYVCSALNWRAEQGWLAW